MPTEQEIFKRLFFGRGQTPNTILVHDLLVLGLCTYRKWDLVDCWWKENPERPEAPSSISCGMVDEQEFQSNQDKAKSYLQTYVNLVRPQQADLKAAVEAALGEELDKIERRWSVSRFWWDVWKNVVGGIAFAFFVALLLWALAKGGIDLPGVEIRTTSTTPRVGAAQRGGPS